MTAGLYPVMRPIFAPFTSGLQGCWPAQWPMPQREIPPMPRRRWGPDACRVRGPHFRVIVYADDAHPEGGCFGRLIERHRRWGRFQASYESNAATYGCPDLVGGDPKRFDWTTDARPTLVNAALYGPGTLELGH